MGLYRTGTDLQVAVDLAGCKPNGVESTVFETNQERPQRRLHPQDSLTLHLRLFTNRSKDLVDSFTDTNGVLLRTVAVPE